jgi:hypothetical protein
VMREKRTIRADATRQLRLEWTCCVLNRGTGTFQVAEVAHIVG